MMAYIAPEQQPEEDYDSWWVRREKQFEQRIQNLMLACRNAERARDEADAHRNRIEDDLAAARALLREANVMLAEQCTCGPQLRTYMPLRARIDTALAGKDAP